MPKRTITFRRFTGGVFPALDPADVPEDAAFTAADADVEPRGFLRGRYADVQQYSGDALEGGFPVDVPFEGGTEGSVVGFDSTTDEVVYFGPFDGATAEERFSVSDDYGFGVGAHPTGIVLPPATAAITQAFPPSANGAYYWLGPHEHEQFGTAADLTLNLEQGPIDTYVDAASPGYVTVSSNPVASGTGSEAFEAGYVYYYAISYVWDGFQETRLAHVADWRVGIPTTAANQIALTLTYDDPGSQPSWFRRVSHVNVYRARAAYDGTTEPSEPDTAYRLVESIALTSAVWTTAAPDRTYVVTDTGAAGTTYEESSGLPETSTGMMPHFTLAAAYGERLFVADCAHNLVERPEYHVFASLPYRYGVFHWARDAVVLPERPVALVAFGGSVFAFSARGAHQINASTLALTRSEYGVGCSAKTAAAAGPEGVLFADTDGVYFHDGQRAYRVSAPIDESATGSGVISWRAFTHTSGPWITYAPRLGAFVVVYQEAAGGSPTFGGYVYTPTRARGAVTVDGSGAVGTVPADGSWRPFSVGYDAVYGLFTGPDGNAHLSVLDGATKRLVALFGEGDDDLGGGTREAWSWTTRLYDLKAEAGARTKLYRIEIAGSDLDGVTAEVAYDGSATFSSITLAAGNDGTYYGPFPAVSGKRPVEGRVQLRLTGDAGSEVSSVVVYHRPLMTRSSTTPVVA